MWSWQESQAAFACVKLKKKNRGKKGGKWLKSNFSAAQPSARR